MLDIKFIRENKELINLASQKKHIDFKVEELIEVDEKRRALMSSVEKKRAEQNSASEKIAKATDPAQRQALIDEMKKVKSDLEKEDESLKELMKSWQNLMLRVPNIPDMSVPDGASDAENKEVKVWGEKTNFAFEPKDHVELMLKHKMVDFERGSKVHGFRGYFLTNDGARLSFAIWNYALEFFGSRGFNPIIPPIVLRKVNFLGSGYLPQGE
jgi:seryl-tRNA synthetase